MNYENNNFIDTNNFNPNNMNSNNNNSNNTNPNNMKYNNTNPNNMNSNPNNTYYYKLSNTSNNDICFVPLNIKQELNPINSSFPLLMNLNTLTTPISPVSNLQQNTPMPIMPYPENIPDMNLSNNTSQNEQNQLEYPDEINPDDLYSYNESRDSENYIYTSINPVDILRNFNFNIDSDETRDNSTYKSIENIFDLIEKNNPSILSTMKAYRIPYPVAKLLIKKIISLTLKYGKR